MICNFCINYNNRIHPIDSILKSENHVYVTLKHKSIHLLHLSSNEKLNSPARLVNNAIFNEQPKSASESQVDSASSVHSLSQLLELTETNRRRSNGFWVNETETFSLIYRNKIKLTSDATNSADAINQSPLPLLFYIHGVGGSSKLWLPSIEYFYSQGYEIVALDLLGHGESSAPDEPTSYEFLEMALDVLLIFDMFCRSTNIVIGHSYGCSFATYLAQTRAEVISRLILISGGSPHPLGKHSLYTVNFLFKGSNSHLNYLDFKNPLLDAPLCLIQLIKPFLKCHFYW